MSQLKVVYMVEFTDRVVTEHTVCRVGLRKGYTKYYDEYDNLLWNAKETLEEAEDMLVRFYENKVDCAVKDLEDVMKIVNRNKGI